MSTETLSLTPKEGESPITSSSTNSLNFDTLLTKIGFGRYQIRVYSMMGTLALAEGASIMSFTLMLPILSHQWNVSDFVNSLQASLIFISFLIGSVLSGQFSDRYGRRKPCLYSSFFMALLSFVSIFSPNILTLIILRILIALLVGFFGPLGATLITELTPKSVRGKFMALLTMSMVIGELYGALVAYFVLDSLTDGNWRLLIFFGAIPGVIAWVVGYLYLLESPRYLLLTGKMEEAFDIIGRIDKVNGGKGWKKEEDEEKVRVWCQEIGGSHDKEKASVKALFQNNRGKVTLCLWFNWFASSFVYYGIIVFLPYILEKIPNTIPEQQFIELPTQNSTISYRFLENSEQFALNSSSYLIDSSSLLNSSSFEHSLMNETTGSAHHNNDTVSDIMKIFLSTAVEIGGVALSATLIDIKSFGRKNSMIIFYTFGALVTVLVYLEKASSFIFLATLARFFMSITFIFCFQYTSEVYPTQIRTTGIGLANGLGRIGGVLMPWVCVGLVQIELYSPFLFFGGLCALAAVTSFLLPFDTTGKDLDGGKEEKEIIK